MPLGLSFIGVLYGAVLISPYNLDAYRYISKAILRIRSTWLSTRAPDIREIPQSSPIPLPSFSVPPTVHQGKHSNAKLVFENIEWLVVWGGGKDGRVCFCTQEREQISGGQFLPVKKKTGKSFSLPAMSHVCRTWRTSDNASEIGAMIDITAR